MRLIHLNQRQCLADDIKIVLISDPIAQACEQFPDNSTICLGSGTLAVCGVDVCLTITSSRYRNL
jgi:hypothetical protein